MDYGQESLYTGFHFEQPLYLYSWTVLVIITFLANIIIITILVQKKMRNPTNTALVAIAITDSLTGLVTLPTYIMAYSNFESAADYSDYMYLHFDIDRNETGHFGEVTDSSYKDTYENSPVNNNNTDYGSYDNTHHLVEPHSVFILTPSLCEWFMISKFFLSQSFHTMSIWLTLYLGIQRCCYVKLPFASQNVFTVRNTVIACVSIVILSPILHIYHVFNRKHSDHGVCEWRLEKECSAGCAYLWISLLLKQLLPCFILVIVTVIFVVSLVRGNEALQGKVSQQRSEDNRRVSFIVLIVMVFFMIPEVPYGVFLFYVVISGHTNTHMDLETNRMIHAIYEVLMVISFHSNFWIYTILNKRFRSLLMSTCVGGYRRISGRLTIITTETRRTYTSGNHSISGQNGQPNESIPMQSIQASEKSSSKTFESNLDSTVANSASV